MASALQEEAATLQHENAIAVATAAVDNLSEQSKLDFFEEVRRFEIRLISRALEVAGGNQARAAQLLGLNPTTLNYKVKTYQML